MLILIEPEEQYLESYREACEEYRERGIRDYSFTNPENCDIFGKFENYRHERNLKSNRVGSDYYWLVDEDEKLFIGEITIRHRLNEALLLRGGHIGYGVRAGQWNKGYGTKMLRLALEKAAEMGLTEILITCDEHNTASARVAEHNGFRLQDKVTSSDGAITRRYWKSI